MARPMGSSNRNKKYLLNRLQTMYGEDFHPIMKIAKNCVELQDAAEAIEIPNKNAFLNDTEALDSAIQGRMAALKSANAEWSRVAEYVEPKLKSIELVAEIAVEEDVVERIDKLAAFLNRNGEVVERSNT